MLLTMAAPQNKFAAAMRRKLLALYHGDADETIRAGMRHGTTLLKQVATRESLAIRCVLRRFQCALVSADCRAGKLPIAR